LQGPVTGQERWEENAGYSPSTLATVIAALVCAADFASEQGRTSDAEFVFAYADWLAAHVEDWTVTTRGELVPGIPRHYIRINPTNPDAPDPHADPNTTLIQVANGGGRHPARNVVGGDFLHLVRFGIRSADDPIVRDSITVIDRAIKFDLPQGPGWRRYNYDGYGDKADGSAFDGAGTGRCWPILTGERGHYELCAGRDPLPYIKAMEGFAGGGEMLPEQVWDADDLPNGSRHRGGPTGAAMPLCWSHAEYVTLVRSRHDGVPFSRVGPAFDRYVRQRLPSRYEVWLLRHPITRMAHGKILRLLLPSAAAVVWTNDNWATTNHCDTIEQPSFGLWYVDFPTGEWPLNATFTFTLFWKNEQRWQGRNWDVQLR
jgi:glucoamylase